METIIFHNNDYLGRAVKQLLFFFCYQKLHVGC